MPDDTVERNWVVLYVARSLGYYGFGPTPEAAAIEYRKAGGSLKSIKHTQRHHLATAMRMTKVTHPEGAEPYLDYTTGSIQFPEGQDGRGTQYEDLRLVNGLWIAL